MTVNETTVNNIYILPIPCTMNIERDLKSNTDQQVTADCMISTLLPRFHFCISLFLFSMLVFLLSLIFHALDTFSARVLSTLDDIINVIYCKPVLYNTYTYVNSSFKLWVCPRITSSRYSPVSLLTRELFSEFDEHPAYLPALGQC